MGLLEWLSGVGRKEPLEDGDRRCMKCLHCYYDNMDREWKCSNFFAPQKYIWLCRKQPSSHTDCPKFDYKG